MEVHEKFGEAQDAWSWNKVGSQMPESEKEEAYIQRSLKRSGPGYGHPQEEWGLDHWVPEKL